VSSETISEESKALIRKWVDFFYFQERMVGRGYKMGQKYYNVEFLEDVVVLKREKRIFRLKIFFLT